MDERIKYPIYRLVLGDDESEGITCISLVDEPAMELPMYHFSKDGMMKFSADEEKHNIISCIARVDFPILRIDGDGRPYYVVFQKDMVEELRNRLMTRGYSQCISLDHNGELIDGISLVELFIKDPEKGLNPKGFEDAADGSLFGIYHIEDEGLWKKVIEGEFGGVSLESYFRIEEIKINNNKQLNMNKIKEMLKAIFLEFNTLVTDKADLMWDEDGELLVGYNVYVEKDGEKVPAEDGEYKADEKIFVVKDGKVEEIREPEAEVEKPVEETVIEEKIDENPDDDRILKLIERMQALEDRVNELEGKVVEIAQTPAGDPVVEEFEKVKEVKTTGDRALDRRIALASALRK